MNDPITPVRRGLLLVAIVMLATACTTTNPTPAPLASPTAAAGSECAAADLGLAGGGWSAAAGSRGADVSVENRGSSACVLPAGPSVAVVDSAGTVLLESEPPTGGPGPTLQPGAVATFTVLFSNWCEEGAALPLQVVLRAGSAGVPVPGLELTGDDLPPCNGPGQPATVSANPWQPVAS